MQLNHCPPLNFLCRADPLLSSNVMRETRHPIYIIMAIDKYSGVTLIIMILKYREEIDVHGCAESSRWNSVLYNRAVKQRVVFRDLY